MSLVVVCLLLRQPRFVRTDLHSTNCLTKTGCCPSCWNHCFLRIDRIERFNELVPRSRTLQRFVLRPHNVRVAVLEEWRLQQTEAGESQGDRADLEAKTPVNGTKTPVAMSSTDPRGPAPASSQHQKPTRRRTNDNGRRRNLTPLKSGKPQRKPLSKLRGGNSTVAATV